MRRRQEKAAGHETPTHLGVDGGVDPGQPPAQVVQLLRKNLLALLQLLQDVGSLQDNRWIWTLNAALQSDVNEAFKDQRDI